MPEELIMSQEEGSNPEDGDQETVPDETSEVKGTEEEAPEEAPKEEEPSKREEAPEEKVDEKDLEIQELRQLLREGKREMSALKERVDSSDKAIDEAGLLSDEAKASAVEQQKAYEQRSGELETMLEMMRLSSKYEDVDKVVSQRHFDDMIEAMATEHSKQQGIPKAEAVQTTEQWVWGMTNPYRYMYDAIKESHPVYVKKEDVAPVKAPTSLQDMTGGTSTNQGGWTEARIDKLDEAKLHTVPKDVYEKYLKNELK